MFENTAVQKFDAVVDRQLQPIRDNSLLNRAMYGLSEAANHSALWLVITWLLALLKPSKASAIRAARISAAIGVESLVLNQGVKRLFKRDRPQLHEEHDHKLRTPQTSSFPSGHATSATCAVVLLGTRRNIWWLGPLAVAVGLSRAVVRIHHPSDVVGGAAFGLFFGALAKAATLPSAVSVALRRPPVQRLQG